MSKSVILVACVLVSLGLIVAENGSANASPINLKEKSLNELKRLLIEKELEEYEKELNEKLSQHEFGSKKSKRSDIDARLLELQAKIMMNRAFNKLSPGYGMFDFKSIGKRSTDESGEDDYLNVFEESLSKSKNIYDQSN